MSSLPTGYLINRLVRQLDVRETEQLRFIFELEQAGLLAGIEDALIQLAAIRRARKMAAESLASHLNAMEGATTRH